jgi:hypothetical protein
MKSKLDPSIYGTIQSAITPRIIEKEINGVMMAEEVRNGEIRKYYLT